MTSPPIVYDILRLFLSAAARTPRGIDRVDIGYARHLFETWPGECVGVLPTPWGMRLYDRARVMRGLDRIEVLWNERNGGPAGPGGALPRLLNLLAATGFSFGRPARDAAPRNALYLNIGQLGWAVGWTLRWLRHRPDIRPVFMLHDLIPLEHPSLVSRLGLWSYRQMFRGVERHASGLILTTQAAGETVLREWRARGRPSVPTLTLKLPVAPVFLESAFLETPAADRAPDPEAACTFVMCGAIDPRKNHRMMLEVWRDLLAARGPAAPRLVVVGSPARGGKPILAALRDCGPLAAHVTVRTGLPSPALRRLMIQARAVLMPSLAEGYGLPIAEALTLGTPVLASDLPAHREVGGEAATYLPATDTAAWVRAISRLADAPPDPAVRARLAQYRPVLASQYFASVTPFLQSFGQRGTGSDANARLKR